MIIFTRASVISGADVLEDRDVWVECNTIVRVSQTEYSSGDAPDDLPGTARYPAGAALIDVKGLYLSAGFIDLHVHGGMGHDFMDASRDAFEGVAACHARHGVTSMLATTLAGDDVETFAFLEAYDRYAANAGETTGCRYLGVHLEGPYFNPIQAGAQDPRYIRSPSPEHYTKLLRYKSVKRFSAAPELDGALELGDFLRSCGVLVSMAHSDADFDQALLATGHGYSLVTHVYSGMQGVHRKNAYRYGGMVEAALLLDGLTAEVIADGRHLPGCLLKLIYKCKGPDGMILVSDATRGAGLPDGVTVKVGSLTRGQDAIIEDGVAKLPDRTAFAGSVASGDRLIRTMVRLAGVPLAEAVAMMTRNPSRLMGLADRIGDVREGMDADVVVFDENVNIKHVMSNGQLRRFDL